MPPPPPDWHRGPCTRLTSRQLDEALRIMESDGIAPGAQVRPQACGAKIVFWYAPGVDLERLRFAIAYSKL